MTTICIYVFIAVSTWLFQFDKLMFLFLQMTSFMRKLICWYTVDVDETHEGNMFLALIGVDTCKGNTTTILVKLLKQNKIQRLSP
jgi:hypothetical protein